MGRAKEILDTYDNNEEVVKDKAVYKKARSKLISIPVISDASQVMLIIRDGVGEDKKLMSLLSDMTNAFGKAFEYLSKKSK